MNCSRYSSPSSALSPSWGLEAAAAGAADGSQFLARESWCRNSVSAVSRALELCYTTACSSSSLPLLHALTGEQLVEEDAT